MQQDFYFDYCIVGLGNIGILISYFLRERKYAVISRRSKGTHMKVVLKRGGEKIWSENVNTFPPDSKIKCDILILSLKAYDIPWALSYLKDKGKRVAIFSNGLGLLEMASTSFGINNSVATSITYGLTSCGENCSEIRGDGEIRIGGMGSSEALKMAEQIAEEIRRGGGKAHAEMNILPHLWLKGIVNSAINPVTAILRKPNGFVVENEYAQEIVEKVAEEGKEIAEKLGISLERDPLEAIIDVASRTKSNYSSMLQDILNGRRTEIDFINGYIVREGIRLGIKVDINLSLYLLVKALENRMGSG
ncbi:MAG: 2-dehydropantoate 2-reductase [Fervidicoccaceae archaeon]